MKLPTAARIRYVLVSDYQGQVCSAARSLEIVGERWTLLILRDLFLGTNKFDDLVESLGITRSVLTKRLQHLLEHGVVERELYQDRPNRYAYRPTAKGQQLYPIIALLIMWGDQHYPNPSGPPRLLLHRDCGGQLTSEFTCDKCHSHLTAAHIETADGPGLLRRVPPG